MSSRVSRWSFKSFRIQLVGQRVSSQSKKITFRRCGKATGRGRGTKRDLSSGSRGSSGSFRWIGRLGNHQKRVLDCLEKVGVHTLLCLTSKSQDPSVSNLEVKRINWSFRLQFYEVSIMMQERPSKFCRRVTGYFWDLLAEFWSLTTSLEGTPAERQNSLLPCLSNPAGCDWKSQRQPDPSQAAKSAARARWIHAQLLLLGERLVESMSFAGHMSACGIYYQQCEPTTNGALGKKPLYALWHFLEMQKSIEIICSLQWFRPNWLRRSKNLGRTPSIFKSVRPIDRKYAHSHVRKMLDGYLEFGPIKRDLLRGGINKNTAWEQCWMEPLSAMHLFQLSKIHSQVFRI